MPEDTTSPKISQNPATYNAQRRRLLMSKLAWSIALIFILAIAAGGYLIYRKSIHFTHYATGGLSTYTLAGATAGPGASFDKPAEFKISTTPPSSKGYTEQVLLIQPASSKEQPDIGRIAMAVATSDPDSINTALANFSLAVAPQNPQDATYQALILPVQDFVNQRLPKGYGVTVLATPRAITTPRISSGAWIIGFTAVGPSKSTPPVVGEITLIYGKKAIYYFMVENISSVWSANQSIWTKVINSLKIDR